MLDGYPDLDEEVTVPDDKPVGKGKKPKKGRKKKNWKILKELNKNLCKHNKLLKQESARRKAEEESAARAAAEQPDQRKNSNGLSQFLGDLGRAVCKAAPKVLTALATAAFNFFVGPKVFSKVRQAA